jgi:hypothetical protein
MSIYEDDDPIFEETLEDSIRKNLSTTRLRLELEKEIIEQIRMGTHNTFADIFEAACGKSRADLFRQVAIAEGKWIKMDGKIFNGS